MNMTHSTDAVVAELRAKPGIDITKLEAGTVVVVETTTGGIFELTVVNPEKGLAEITGTDPHFHRSVVGQLLCSSAEPDGDVKVPNWIGETLCMHLRFLDCTFVCCNAHAATVIGTSGWRFDVF